MTDAPIRLLPDEHVVLDLRLSPFWTLTRYLFTLGFWSIWRQRHRIVLTNQRLVVAKGIVNRTEAAISLARVQDVHLKTSVVTGGGVALSSTGGSLGVGAIVELTRADATALTDAISARIGTAGTSVEYPAQTPPEQRVEGSVATVTMPAPGGDIAAE